MFATIAALLLQWPILDFEHKAARIPLILGELSSKTGMKLDCDGAFENEVVVVYATKVEPLALLDRIAHATAGKWETRKGALTLVPDLPRRAREEEARVSEREKKIQFALDSLAKELAEPYDARMLDKAREYYEGGQQTRDYVEAARYRRVEPLTRACARAAIALGAKTLAKAERGTRFVFATQPNRLQTQWRVSPEFWTVLRREWDVLQAASSGWGDRVRPYFQSGRSLFNGAPDTNDLGEIGAAWLSVADPLRQSSFHQIELTIASPDGNVERTGTLRFEALSPPPPTAKAGEIPDVDLPLDPLTIEASQAIATTYQPERKPLTKSSPLYAYLADPLSHDPLELGSEAYLGYAKARGLDLVASLNDNSFYRATMSNLAPVKTKKFETMHRPYFAWTEEDGWLVLSPSEPALARRNRDDRKALAKFMAGVLADGHVDLDERAQYLLSRPYAASSGFGAIFGSVVDPQLNRGSFEMHEDAQRLWASLSSSQKRDGRVPFFALDAKCRQYAERAIFGDRLARRKQNPYAGAPFESDVWTEADRGNFSYGREPTRLFPNGIPSDAVLTLLDRKQQDLDQFLDDTNHIYYGQEPFYAAASNVFFSRHPELVTGDVGAHKFANRYVPYEKRMAGVMLDLPGEYAWIAAFSDRRALSGRVPLEQLPPAFREAIDAQLAKMEKQREDGNPPRMIFGSGNAGNSKIPPR